MFNRLIREAFNVELHAFWSRLKYNKRTTSCDVQKGFLRETNALTNLTFKYIKNVISNVGDIFKKNVPYFYTLCMIVTFRIHL